MSAKRLFGTVVPLVFVAVSVMAQPNELSVTAGRTFVSTQTIVNPPAGDPNPNIHFGNEEAVAFNYGRYLTRKKFFGFYAEVPVAIYFRMDLNTYTNQIPKDIGALFATPSLRVHFFSGESLTPWVSAGGGYGRFRYSSDLNYYGSNPGPEGSNTGVAQFGGGLDAWILHHWGVRAEARDFYSGKPNLNVVTSTSRQHNYYVGIGVLHRF